MMQVIVKNIPMAKIFNC